MGLCKEVHDGDSWGYSLAYTRSHHEAAAEAYLD